MGDMTLFRGMWAKVAVYCPSNGQTMYFDIGSYNSGEMAIPFFRSMTVKTGLESGSDVRVELAPPSYQDFIDLIESPWVRLGNTLMVQWGYTDSESFQSPEYFSMMQKPEVTIDQEFAISLIGRGFDFDVRRRAAQKVWATEDNPKSIVDVVKEIAAKWKMKLLIDGKEPSAAISGLSSQLVALLFSPRRALVQSGVNTWGWLKRELGKCACWFWIERGIAMHITTVANAMPPKSTFVLGGVPDFENREFPMWGFNTDTSAFFVAARAPATSIFGPNAPRESESLVRTVKDQTQRIFDVPVPQLMMESYMRSWAGMEGSSLAVYRGRHEYNPTSGELPAAPDAGVSATADMGDGEASNYLPFASQEELAQLYTQAQTDINVSELGVRIEFDTLDDPTLIPGDKISTKNLGSMFSGTHMVFEIEHTIGSDIGSMRLTCGIWGTHPSGDSAQADEGAGL